MAAQGQQTAPLVPRKIISFTGEEATFHSEVLDKELYDNNALYDQLYVISIVGIVRSGKSFLINLMMKYLDHYSQHGNDEGWDKSHMAITGVNWARSRQTVTHGVWCFIYPKLIRNMRVMLMDFQGTGDKTQSTLNLDKMLLFYSLTLSNLTMLNVVGNFDTRDLDTLHVCTLGKGGTQLHLDSEDLLVLVRDWDDEEEPEQREEIERDTVYPDLKKTAKAIRKACRTVRTRGLPHPGRKLMRANEIDGLRISDVDGDFTAACKQLFRELLIAGPVRSANTKSGADFVYKFEILSLQMLSQDAIGKVQSPMEACVNSLITDAWNDAQKTLERKVEVLKGYGYVTENEIKQVLHVALEEATRMYKSDARVVRLTSQQRKRNDLDGLKKIHDKVLRRLLSELKQRQLEDELAKLKTKMEEERKKRLQQEAEAKRMVEDRAKAERLRAEKERLEAEKRTKTERLKVEKERLERRKREAEKQEEEFRRREEEIRLREEELQRREQEMQRREQELRLREEQG